jgi:hypothetical protein
MDPRVSATAFGLLRPGMTKARAACFYRDDGLSRKRDTETTDMFREKSEEN